MSSISAVVPYSIVDMLMVTREKFSVWDEILLCMSIVHLYYCALFCVLDELFLCMCVLHF